MPASGPPRRDAGLALATTGEADEDSDGTGDNPQLPDVARPRSRTA
jgi:hypothetical protein